MALIRLVYESSFHRGHEPTLASIFRTGRRNNTADHLTGLTLVSGQSVLEILEGESEVVKQTFQRIRSDPRHTISRVLSEGPIDRRYFSKWSAGIRQSVDIVHKQQQWKDSFVFDGTDDFSSDRCPTEVMKFLEDFAQRSTSARQ